MSETRQIRVQSNISQFDMLVLHVNLDDTISKSFNVELQLLSETSDWDFAEVVGKPMTLVFVLPNGEERYFNGIVSHFSQVGWHGRYSLYRATLHSWMWLLDRNIDCRIFQNKSVPTILKEVFDAHGFSYEERYSNSYTDRVYCVQYNESDTNFVNRLMEEEGIYYYFEHTESEHSLILCDDISAHQALTAYSTIPYFDDRGDVPMDTDHIGAWSPRMQIEPGTVTLRDYDFTKPKADLTVAADNPHNFDYANFEIYSYPGCYEQTSDGERNARLCLEERQTDIYRVSGRGNTRGMCVGGLFTLEDHPRDDQNQECLIVSTKLMASVSGYETGESESTEIEVNFEAMPSTEIFRATRNTPKPRVRGPQTAIVVGPSGEEIWTDEYGRIKCQFHWDREGKFDDKSSCWIRVSQPWAGKNWGGVSIPRIGQEVVVDFLEGDPDKPIVTGRVYNDDQPHPYDLPANKTQSGIKSRSSKGGSPDNYNELLFEDKAGAEKITLHAEKDQSIEVENDEAHWVGNDRTKNVDNNETVTIGVDRTENVGSNETITIGADRTEDVGSNETITIGSDRTENVGSNENITIGADRTENVGSNESITIGSSRTKNVGSDETVSIGSNRTENVGSNETVTIGSMRTHNVGINDMVNVGAAQEITVGAAQTITVGAMQAVTVGAIQQVSVGASQSVDVGTDQKVEVGGSSTTEIGKDGTLKAGESIVIDAGESIILKTGKASIALKKDGTIAIEGKDINIKASGAVNVKASKDIVLKGKNVLGN